MIGNLKEIKEILGVEPFLGDEKVKVESVSIDTRTLTKGAVFVALSGEFFNGNDYIDIAVDKGAVAVVSTEHEEIKIPLIKVEDAIKAYQKIANYYRNREGFKVVAITGSSGKTTTKDMVACVLEKKLKVSKTYKNNNNEIGLPYTILSSPENTDVLVLEMGMRSLGEIRTLTETAEPDIGIITNVGIAHVGELGSEENILKAKRELFEEMKSNGIAIINGEDKYTRALEESFTGAKKVFGFHDNATIKATEIVLGESICSFKVIRDGETYYAELPFTGEHLILDALVALETGALLGISIKQGIEALKKLEVSPGRMSVEKLAGNITILDDVYNANPDSTKASLKVLTGYKGREIAILGDMRDLGALEKPLHKEVGAYVAKLGIDYLITVGSASNNIWQGAVDGGMNSNQAFSYMTNEDAFKKLNEILKENDTVLIKGSRLVGMEKIIELLKKER
ncbi:hypothetical protein AZF37_02375 [endosymbiont 'TC1' of Trimyema compressum]|uniref:UDP-N-acetylmuramoyl-tripeptide--D-alanyl-D- alanine ligase n=1 Tax=endosymbiont 'TC1' of Trimyema compressum TaxID=243899 RepID=UPI0007F15744|nr:UDP-N-acetylmuramoyl-tripeptide--D-alanyl-D-alanine ligase [endosymbiont 'TC1' of Trimyema compressum]AMP20169.1 hypothetical protein AZF37_02375 [endosymbiont 'TC1' of Trimyema compressum]